MRPYDPVYQLAAREAVRFVGTVGDIASDVCPLFTAIVDTFSGREVRTELELIEAIQRHRKSVEKNPSTTGVARHTLEVAASLRLLEAFRFGSGRNRKYGLGTGGRVLLAMKKHQRWTKSSAALVLRRPMFEYNGDYLLQAMCAIEAGGPDRTRQLETFAKLVRELTASKLQELPTSRSGLSWDTYVQELKQRQWWVRALSKGIDTQKPTLEELKRARQTRATEFLGGTQKRGAQPSGAIFDSKTFDHHFARCRSWLIELGLVERRSVNDSLTHEGERLLKYFRAVSRQTGPARIPPTASLLKDAFRLSDDEIMAAWGAIVDEQYWESGLFDLSSFGTYSPTNEEFFDTFASSFDLVRFQRISEAPILAVREVVFLSFLWNQKPLRPKQLTDLIDELMSKRGDIFGLGRNRQGRPAFIFRKKQ
jgi:hypothetical protein